MTRIPGLQKMRTALVITLGAALLTGCETLPGDNGGPLTGTSWKLVAIEIAGNRTTVSPAASDRHRITFERGGNLQLALDCNTGRSNWSVRDTGDMAGTLVIGEIASTRALCPPPSFGEDMAAELPSTRSFRIVPATGRLRIVTRRTEYVFEKIA